MNNGQKLDIIYCDDGSIYVGFDEFVGIRFKLQNVDKN